MVREAGRSKRSNGPMTVRQDEKAWRMQGRSFQRRYLADCSENRHARLRHGLHPVAGVATSRQRIRPNDLMQQAPGEYLRHHACIGKGERLSPGAHE